jgi:hypothetical protein
MRLTAGNQHCLIGVGRVAAQVVGKEDGVLPAWFRKPHPRYGTTHRILNTLVGLQLVTLVLSRGNVYVLGEAYAFGVVWSFAFKGLAVLVLRFTEPGPREWRVPLNVRFGRLDLPLGLGVITLGLFAVALTNLLTKQLATISGLSFTAVLFGAFLVSERATAARRARSKWEHGELDEFQLLRADDPTLEALFVRPAGVLVAVRDYTSLTHVRWALADTNVADRDVVVMTVRILAGPDTGFRDLRSERLFTDYEQLLFTRVVAIAEREGRPVKLLVVPSSNVYDAIAQTAFRLKVSEIVLGESAKFTGAEQARQLGAAWERGRGDQVQHVRLQVWQSTGEVSAFHLGPHAPPLSADDLVLIHRMWLKAVARLGLSVHHRDIVRTALEELDREMTKDSDRVIARIKTQVARHDRRTPGSGP